MPNVLVFESDSVFAGELKGQLETRGCTVTVVDDASVGLQTAATDKPDLILLTIELPRMNGFSVCNKLKRDPALKEVPLIIMSSDSTEETFEQHRRLRTHAEDYVHKPIVFTDLLARITAHVAIGAAAGGASAGEEDIVIDDDIDFEEDGSGEPKAAATEAEEPAPPGHVDEEVDKFTDAAFGSIMDQKGEAAPQSLGGEAIAVLSEPPASLDLEAESLPPSAAPSGEESKQSAPKVASIPPRRRADSIDQSLKDDLAKQADRVRELEKELRETRSRISDLEDEATRAASKDSEVQRLQRELDETKAKAAAGSKGGGSAREFLDLREALNKKDKELLDLRDQVTHREKDLLGLRDTNLAGEREKADLNDRIGELERQTTDLGRQLDGAKADKDQAAKRADDFKRKGEKLQGELEARIAELSELKRKQEEEAATRDAREAALRAEHQEAIERAEGATKAAAAAEEATRVAVAEGQSQKTNALAEAAERAEKDRLHAVSTREVELKKEHDSKLAALHRANEDAMNRLKAEHAQVLADAEKASAARAAEEEAKRAREHEAVVKEHEAAGELVRDELSRTSAALEIVQNAKAEGEASRDARIASLESDLAERARTIDAAKSTLEEREASLSATAANLAATHQELIEARAENEAEQVRASKAKAKWAEDRSSLERAKDALAAALAQLDEIENRPLE
jgi:CheY-like chemotaxis protein